MKHYLFGLSLMVMVASPALAQKSLTNDETLAKEIRMSGIIHSPLPLDKSRSFDALSAQRKGIVKETILWQAGDATHWQLSGLGKVTYENAQSASSKKGVRLSVPLLTNKRAQGDASDPDYATYGNSSIIYEIEKADWEKYNRIHLRIYPDCEGVQIVNMDFNLLTDNSSAKKGYEIWNSSHLLNLTNKRWNDCYLEIGNIQRDKVKGVSLTVTNRGKDKMGGDSLVYYVDSVSLQQVAECEKESGWIPNLHTIVYSTTGYEADGIKIAILNEHCAERFQLIDGANGETVFSGEVKKTKSSIGSFSIADFSKYNTPGRYKLIVGKDSTNVFTLSNHLWTNSVWRTLNFIFCQRCGYTVPTIHSTCHNDLFAKYNHQLYPYSGGWHDAGDLSQQTLQTGDVTFSLLELYNKVKGCDTILAQRLLEEAEWGLDFIAKTRFGNGYHASSMGLLIWQDGIVGSADDITSVRIQNNSFDNFLYAAYEAYAALSIGNDNGRKEYLTKIAKEDFKLAMQKYRSGADDKYNFPYEHSYSTSLSQYHATISWSASMLYKLTRDNQYANIAVDQIRYTMSCQQREPLTEDGHTCGFFYRDTTRVSIVHSIHQSREQIYMEAFIALCELQPSHPEYDKWKQSIRLYANYLKGLMPYTAPYGMIPSGIYKADEYKDSASFNSLYLNLPVQASELYTKQLHHGICLSNEYFVRRFPVWFSVFNGNNAIILSMGKSAALCGNFLHDKELMDIGREQLYWIVGKNPFGQSLIYGEGYNYPQMDSFSSGEMTGEIPVGIRSHGNDDIPYWPAVNNACYKEVWVTAAGKWLSLISEYQNQTNL
jgi:hypothetical protein